MDRRDLTDLLVFQAVADVGSFTRAAARMGRSQSGLSQIVSELEARLGVPLLARSTRSVRLTEAGQRLLDQVSPALRQIADGLEGTKAGRNSPSGTLRLTAMEYPAQKILLPVLPDFLAQYPGVNVDIHVNERFVDIVKGGFDAGIRLGDHLEQDMIAVPIGAELRVAIVGAPGYFAARGRPQRLEDLANHDCINIRLASHGDIFRWRLLQGKRTIELTVNGRTIVNGEQVIVQTARAGLGLAYTFEPVVADDLASGTLETCLEAFCPVLPGYQLFYPSRQQRSPALCALIEHLRSR